MVLWEGGAKKGASTVSEHLVLFKSNLEASTLLSGFNPFYSNKSLHLSFFEKWLRLTLLWDCFPRDIYE